LRSALFENDAEALRKQLPLLEAAAEQMKVVADAGARADQLKELNGLSRDLASCRKLIDQGSTTARILASILSSGSAGYCRNGAPPAVETTATVLLRG